MSGEAVQVLYVEDNPADARLVRAYLERHAGVEFELRSVSTLRDGIAQLGEGSPDLVLLDLSLPDAHGLTGFEQLRAASGGIPVIVVTGLDDEAIAVTAAAEGAQDYLVKGQFSPEMLLRSVRYALERTRLTSAIRRTAERLEQSHERMRRLVEASPHAVLVLGEDGAARLVNTAAEQLLGRPRDELLALSDPLPLRGDAGSSAPRELTIVRPGGEVRVVEERVVPTEWDGAPAQLVSLHDITERREAERALARERDLVRRISDTAPIGILGFDASGAVTFANSVAEQVLGLTGSEIAERTYDDSRWTIEHLDGSPMALEEAPIGRVLATGEPVTDTMLVVVRADGSRAILEVNATPVMDPCDGLAGVVATIDDITERVRTQEALRTAREHLRHVVEHAPTVIYSAPFEPRARPSYVTENVERLLGHPSSAVYGDPGFWRAHTHPDDAQGWSERRRALARGDMHSYEYRFRRPDGGYVWVRDVATPVLDDEGRVVEVVVQVSDIAERRTLETQLEHAQRMEAVGRLAGGIAHDFNNLLTVILAYGEMLVAARGPDRQDREELEQIVAAGRKASALTAQLLAFSRRQVLAPKLVDLNGIVADTQRLLRRLIGEDIQIDLRLDPELETVRVDPGQIEQVLMNLAVNARDAMPEGGRLTFETVRDLVAPGEAPGPNVELEPGRYVRLSVSDTGHGIPAATLERIFEPFFTTKQPGRGTGLGLATVYGIVRQSQGAIHVESEVGRGTTFHLWLPVASRLDAEPSTDDVRKGPVSAAPAAGTGLVLIIEDEVPVRRLTAHILERAGYEVVVAATGAEAIERAREQGGRIDLVVSDVVMPDGRGPEVVAQLGELAPGARVLFVSGYPDGNLGAGRLPIGDVPFLAKPFTADQLERKVAEVLGRAAGTAGRER